MSYDPDDRQLAPEADEPSLPMLALVAVGLVLLAPLVWGWHLAATVVRAMTKETR